MTASLHHVDEGRLERELAYRFDYLTRFIGFGPDDIKAIHAAAPLLADRVSVLVDAVYEKLFTFDATKRHFLPRQYGYEGEVPRDIDALTLDHELIRFRKKHLANYLARLVTGAYDDKMVAYLDQVGKMHTPGAGNRDIAVPLVQMNALMGFVADALLSTILTLDLDSPAMARTLRAFNKLLWLQNDLIARHYVTADAARDNGPS